MAQGTSEVYIIRHGEKKWTLGCLSSLGEARGQNLVNVFSGKSSAAHSKFGVPKAIFANWYDDHIDCERCLQLITPLSKILNIEPDHTHGGDSPGKGPGGGNAGAAVAIKEALKATGGPVLVAWESENIHYLATSLGVKDAPRWHNRPWFLGGHDDYDSVWILSFDSNQTLVSFSQSRQDFTNNSTIVV
jgi:hypothetical protein